MSVNPQNSAVTWTYLNNETVQYNHLKQLKNQNKNLDTDLILESKLKQIGMTRNPNRKCRKETFIGNELSSWGDAVQFLESYIQDKRGLEHILQNKENGDKIYIENSHRFEESYKKKQMGKFYSIESKAKEYYGEENLKTVMVTLSASPYMEDGRLRSPIDHLDSIMDRDKGSWNAVKSAMDRVLRDYEYEYMRILEPHTPKGDYGSSGYAHKHLGIIINDPNDELEAQDFKPLLNSHINNCKTAGDKAHTVNNSVSCVSYDEDEEGGIGAYLTAYMGEMMDGEFENQDEYFKRFLATLWLSNRRRVGFSKGANQWAKEDFEEEYGKEENDDTETTEWEYWGIAQEDEDGNVEETEVDGGHTGSYLETMPERGYLNEIQITNIHNNPPPD
jgi:hypothetical protein